MTEEIRMRLLGEISLEYRAEQIWNPISPEGLRLAAEYAGVAEGRSVLDVGCGTGAMLCDWACNWSVIGTGVDVNADFLHHARTLAAKVGVAERLEFITADLQTFTPKANAYDIVTCIGSVDALGGFTSAVPWLAQAARPGGTIAIGDAHSLREIRDRLADRVAIAHDNGLELVGSMCSSLHDWDAYYSRQWRAGQTWAAANPGHPDREWLLDRMREQQRHYFEVERGQLQWSLLVFTKA